MPLNNAQFKQENKRTKDAGEQEKEGKNPDVEK